MSIIASTAFAVPTAWEAPEQIDDVITRLASDQ